jgi:hypothetical protein
MPQSATKLVMDAIENKKKVVESESRESPGSRGSRTITRSELEAVVRDGVREGLSEYEREAGTRVGELERTDVESVDDEAKSDDSSSGRSGLRTLVLIGLLVAGILYLRRRSSNDDAHS